MSARFGTKDFEVILKLPSQTNRVNEILGIQDDVTSTAYEEAKEALVQTGRMIHPSYLDVEDTLVIAAEFMANFKQVVSLN